MEPGFWHERWETQQIGFHQGEVNPFLVEHWHSLGLTDDAQVFVPLCGKSLDMFYLAEQGHEILGCELNEIACQQFFEENELPLEISPQGDHTLFNTEQLTLCQGDIFTMPKQLTQGCNGFYDRAALIAWPETMRRQYVQTLAELLPEGARGLLITLDFAEDVISGPPFAVSQNWIEQNMADLFDIELLSETDVLAENPRFLKKNATWLNEAVYRLIRK